MEKNNYIPYLIFTDFCISLSFFKFKIKISEKVIIIDTGHEGNDLGSIGPNGTREKDITKQTKTFRETLREKE
ncbi:hypothetical protein ACQVUB_25955 [Bacillus mycoides]|uniref:hypothetical protein n=1 Tax=Bacillus mycoides TaxID=1405 RepID=UPI003D65DD2B